MPTPKRYTREDYESYACPNCGCRSVQIEQLTWNWQRWTPGSDDDEWSASHDGEGEDYEISAKCANPECDEDVTEVLADVRCFYVDVMVRRHEEAALVADALDRAATGNRARELSRSFRALVMWR